MYDTVMNEEDVMPLSRDIYSKVERDNKRTKTRVIRGFTLISDFTSNYT